MSLIAKTPSTLMMSDTAPLVLGVDTCNRSSRFRVAIACSCAEVTCNLRDPYAKKRFVFFSLMVCDKLSIPAHPRTAVKQCRRNNRARLDPLLSCVQTRLRWLGSCNIADGDLEDLAICFNDAGRENVVELWVTESVWLLA